MLFRSSGSGGGGGGSAAAGTTGTSPSEKGIGFTYKTGSNMPPSSAALSQALNLGNVSALYTGDVAGEIQKEKGLGEQQPVWNIKSLLLKDILGI